MLTAGGNKDWEIAANWALITDPWLPEPLFGNGTDALNVDERLLKNNRAI